MTVSFVVLCASGSVLFGVLFGRIFAWWQEVKDEEQVMADANIRARFQPNYEPIWEDITDQVRSVQRPGPFDWSSE